MTPNEMRRSPTKDLFKNRLENIIDMRHELVCSSILIDRNSLSEEFKSFYNENFECPGIPILILLQPTYNLSSEAVVIRWCETYAGSCLCTLEYFQYKLPIYPISLIKWREWIGRRGRENMLSLIIQAGLEEANVIAKRDTKRAIDDTTVQEKNIALTDSAPLYAKAFEKLAAVPKKLGIQLCQAYPRKAKTLAMQIDLYAHAKQFKRMRKPLRTLQCFLRRGYREVKRKAFLEDLNNKELSKLPSLVEKLLHQTQTSKNKISFLHDPEAECILEGKTQGSTQYEFENKVALNNPLEKPFNVAIDALQGTPSEGQTLDDSFEQIHHLTGIRVEQAFADQGYRGHNTQHTQVFHSRQNRGVTKTIKQHFKRRQSIELIIGHLKQDAKLGCNYFKDLGNDINAILSRAEFNFIVILNKINLIPRASFSFYNCLGVNSSFCVHSFP